MINKLKFYFKKYMEFFPQSGPQFKSSVLFTVWDFKEKNKDLHFT